MDIFKIVGIGLAATAAALVIKPQRPEISLQLVILTGTIIFLMMITKISSVIDLINSFANKAGLELVYLRIIIKVTGIAYITEFASSICRDSGETALASKVEFAGKVIILTMAIPIIGALLNLLIKIIP